MELVLWEEGFAVEVMCIAEEVFDQLRLALEVDVHIGESEDGPSVLAFIRVACEELQDQHFWPAPEDHRAEGRLPAAAVKFHQPEADLFSIHTAGLGDFDALGIVFDLENG